MWYGGVYLEIVIATRGVKATCGWVIVTIALHLQSTSLEDLGVVWPRGIGKIYGLGVWVERTLENKWTITIDYQHSGFVKLTRKSPQSRSAPVPETAWAVTYCAEIRYISLESIHTCNYATLMHDDFCTHFKPMYVNLPTCFLLAPLPYSIQDCP